jgi:protein associated with RNAse G/E
VGDAVRVVYRKYDGRLHWHAVLDRLGEDEHGVWLGAGIGVPWRRGNEPPVVLDPHVMLFPRDGWWVAAFNAEPRRTEIYVDMTTVPQWPTPDEVSMIDLDLDVLRMRADGAVHLVDEDEFAEHQVAFGYPADIIEGARRSAEEILARITTKEPFVSAYRPWLALVAAAMA